MHCDHLSVVGLHAELSDEAAAETVELLYEIARVIENNYAAQIRRHRFTVDERQRPLWEETDPPF